MTTIPPTITILQIPYAVKLCKTLKEVDESEDFLGRFSSQKSEIRVLEMKSVEATWQILLHEVVHEIVTATGAHKLIPEMDGNITDPEETVVSAISAGIFSFLLENKLLRLPDEPVKVKGFIGGEPGEDE